MHVGIIGYGNIARALTGHLAGLGVTDITALVRPGSQVQADVTLVTDIDALLATQPDVVVECAGHAAVRALGPAVLRAGLPLVVVSVGALADRALHETLLEAQHGAGRMIFPIGAIGGLDLLSTLALAGDVTVTYRGTKPPAAWKGSPAEGRVNLDGLAQPTTFYQGSARDTARDFPKNANVVAALALAGAGFDATRAELVAAPSATGNTHSFDVISPLCRYSMQIAAQPSPDNPRTSATTAWSVVTEIKRLMDSR